MGAKDEKGRRTPLLATLLSKGGEEAGQDHEDVGHDNDEDVGAAHAGQQGEVEQQERRRDAPVNVAGPEDLAVDVLRGVRTILVRLAAHVQHKRVAVTGRHGEVRHRGEEGDEGGQDVEETFLLRRARVSGPTSFFVRGPRWYLRPERDRPWRRRSASRAA